MSADPAAPLPTAIESERGRVTHDPLTQIRESAAAERRQYEEAQAEAAKRYQKQAVKSRAVASDAAKHQARVKSPAKARNDRLTTMAAAEALRVLRDRHQDEYNAILREIRDAMDLPSRDLVVVADPESVKPPCKGPHRPVKRSFGLFCGECDTKLN